MNTVVERMILLCRRKRWKFHLFFAISCQVIKPKPPRRIRLIMLMFTTGFPTYSVREEKGSLKPIKSKPTLQKADTEWKTLYQRPHRSPNSGINCVARITAKNNSIIPVHFRRKINIFMIPPWEFTEMELARVFLWEYPIFFPKKRMTEVTTTTTPSPPIWIKKRMTACPKKDQCVAVSYTIKPVTQEAEVEVKGAFRKGV